METMAPDGLQDPMIHADDEYEQPTVCVADAGHSNLQRSMTIRRILSSLGFFL